MKRHDCYDPRFACCRNIWWSLSLSLSTLSHVVYKQSVCYPCCVSKLEPLEHDFTVITSFTGSPLWNFIRSSRVHTQNHRLYPYLKRDFGNTSYMLIGTENRAVATDSPAQWTDTMGGRAWTILLIARCQLCNSSCPHTTETSKISLSLS